MKVKLIKNMVFDVVSSSKLNFSFATLNDNTTKIISHSMVKSIRNALTHLGKSLM